MSEVLKLDSVCKSYSSPAGGRINILSDVSLSISKGEVVAIVGRSGSGKSTLLFIAALLSTPDSGKRDGIRVPECRASCRLFCIGKCCHADADSGTEETRSNGCSFGLPENDRSGRAEKP